MASGTWVAAQAPADSNWKPLEDAMGRPGQVQSADVIRFGMPRKDLHVTLGDVTVKCGAGTRFMDRLHAHREWSHGDGRSGAH
jgi:hypothetical protein